MGLFYVAFLTVPVYIQWDKFIIVQVNLSTPYHHVTSNCMFGFKSLHMNPLNIVILLALKVVLVYHSTTLKTISTILKSKYIKVNTQRKINIFVATVCSLSKQYISQIIHWCFGHVSITRVKRMARKGLMEGIPNNLPTRKKTPLFVS